MTANILRSTHTRVTASTFDSFFVALPTLPLLRDDSVLSSDQMIYSLVHAVHFGLKGYCIGTPAPRHLSSNKFGPTVFFVLRPTASNGGNQKLENKEPNRVWRESNPRDGVVKMKRCRRDLLSASIPAKHPHLVPRSTVSLVSCPRVFGVCSFDLDGCLYFVVIHSGVR